jgi:hypothetical protein
VAIILLLKAWCTAAASQASAAAAALDVLWHQVPVLLLGLQLYTRKMLQQTICIFKHVSVLYTAAQVPQLLLLQPPNSNSQLQPTRWNSLPSGPTRLKGLDHIHRPFVHGLWLCASWKPVLWPSSWFRM